MMLARIPRDESLKGTYLIIWQGATTEYRPLMSRGLVFDIQEFIKSEINMPNEYLFVLNSKVYACSDHILANFSSITQCFATKKIGIFRVKFIAFPSVEFPKI